MFKRFIIGTVAGCTSACVYVQYQWSAFDNNAGQAEYIRAHQAATPHNPDLGSHPVTYYSCGKLREEPLRTQPLRNHLKDSVDVCVIGGGLAGLHTALALAEKGKRVVILERRQIGCGASGRNGGDAVVGFHTPPAELAEFVGKEKAAALYQQSISGYNRLKNLILKHKIHCGMEEVGAITMSFQNRVQNSGKSIEDLMKEDETECLENQKLYGEEVEVWDVGRVQQSGLRSPRYAYGLFNKRNMSLNPLELVHGLGRACVKQGVQIYESSPVVSVEAPSTRQYCSTKWLVTTAEGSVEASDVVLATASAPAWLAPELAIATAPLVTAMMMTKPIEKALLDQVLTNKYAVFDERFALAYYRRVEGNRILFGSLARGVPMKGRWAEAKLVHDLCTTFPSLRGHVFPEVSWQGRLDAKLPVFPMLGRTSSGMWYSLGYSGHGLVPTCAGGELLANAIVTKNDTTPDVRYTMWNEVSHMPDYPMLPVHAPIGGPVGMLGSVAFCYWTTVKDWMEKKY